MEAAQPQVTINTNLRLPPELNLTSGNISEHFKSWKRQVQIYLLASGTQQLQNSVQTATIINCGGERLLKVYDHFEWNDGEDKDNPDHVFQKIEQYCNPRKNEVAESHKFWTLKYFEPVDQFLTELRIKAASCNFQEEDRMLRDKIVFSTSGKVQQLLLRDDDLDLRKAVKICQSYEQANKQAQEMKEEGAKVNKVNKAHGKQKKIQHNKTSETRQQKQSMPSYRSNLKPCKFCGTKHEFKKHLCPAWGKTCNACHGRNHFQNKCRKVNTVGAQAETDTYSDSDSDEVWLNAVSKNTPERKIVTALMEVNECKIRFQLDSAAEVNTICRKFVKKDQVRKSTTMLRMFNDTKMKPCGETELLVKNLKNGETKLVTFVVVSNKLQCLLGLKTIQQMGLITVNDERFIAKVKTSSTILGDLGEATLTVDPDITPKALPSRKIPIALKDGVKAELDNLVERGVLAPISTPTRWVSQMAVVHKPNGKLRICIDPQALNAALLREQYALPVLDDILPKLQKAKIFSKLDVKEAFWHVRLDEKSSELTTMITPFGRYRWKRLPFGLKVSSEIFQRKLTEALGDLEGTFALADDIIVAGCGDTVDDARRDNDLKLEKLYKRCDDVNIVLNDSKKEIGLSEITFHGHKITSEGVKADETKVEAILHMPSPTDVPAVKRFCGMVQYMAKFIPSLSSKLDPLRALTRKDADWNWTCQCEDAFREVKQMLTQTPVLAYFNPEKELVLQVDSSKDGLGAVLMQDGRPIEYASRALTTAERKWAQIEKEALSILHGLQRFDQYTYGRKVVVVNDHKPLETILRKPLSSAPRRLQDIMMKLHKYDIDFRFLKGEKLVIADTLSRAYGVNERPRVMMLNEDIPKERLDEIRIETTKHLSELRDTIESGWPNSKDACPDTCKPFYDVRDTLSVYNELIVKGEAIVIPQSLRTDIKRQLHKSHLGYDSMLRRAKETVYWPGIRADLKQMADSCEACQELKPRNSNHLLQQHDDGGKPWNKIGMDLFEINRRTYLVCVDYYTNFIEVDYLPTTTSSQVISVLRKQFARFGIPSKIISDGGPQFTSSEFHNFTKKWEICHTYSSPNHQRANGKAESAVKIMKHMMMKCNKDKTDQYEALMEQRNTPRQETGQSPAQMMFGRQTQTLVPHIDRKRESKLKKREHRRQTIKRYHDKRARDQTRLRIGQNIYFERKSGERWILGKVINELGSHTYIVKSQDGGTYRRNRLHIRPTKVEAYCRDQSPIRFSENLAPAPTPISNPTKGADINTSPQPNSQPIAENDTGNPKDKSTVEENIITREKPIPAPRRSVRLRQAPTYFKDYVRH